MLENILFSMNSTMPLFFIMLLGYVLHRTGFLSDAFVAGANKFVFYVALPVQLFRDLGKNDVRATFDGQYGKPCNPPGSCFDFCTSFWYRICLACCTGWLVCQFCDFLCGT